MWKKREANNTFNKVFLSCYSGVLDVGLKRVLRETTLSISANSE